MIFILITVIKTCCKTVTTVTKRMSEVVTLSQTFLRKPSSGSSRKAFFTTFFWGHELCMKIYHESSYLILKLLRVSFPNQLVTKIFHWTLWELQRSHLGWLENDPVKLHLLLHSLVTEAWKPSQFDTLHKRTRCTIFKIDAWLSMPRCSPWKPIKNKFN